ncbi:NAD-dependent epimerase/dehydratase family protein [Streptomyces mobaraensis]|uniref:NAD-dependent epimerase/dehydratase family protein n=1 Tax=Streptomyces mobaraensis TaxID=35621 RepID=A0A5N5W1B0_STRMB|nr:NAD-dependent epimerase/dehydratase family protein [Streptomyces mobaraensis]KAB7835576.1 NAD-dependent epimerase/dehydratase family protein [Streptomyces mobaraensis]
MSPQPRDELTGARVLITGGAGFIGTSLRTALAQAGARPALLDNLSAYGPTTLTLLSTGPTDEDLTVGDINDEALVRRLVAEADYVVHAAAHSSVHGCTTDPQTAVRSNLTGTDTVLRAVAASRTVRRFILLSTAQVYGHGAPHTARPEQAGLFTEDQPLDPLNIYANSKLWAEGHTRQLLGAAERDYTILRPFSVYGPGQVPKPGAASWVVAQFTMYAALGQQLLLNNGGRQVRDFIFRDDVADAIRLCLTTPAASRQILNLGTGTPTSVREVAEHVRRHFPEAEIVDAPRVAQDPLGACADTTRMRSVLDWSPSVDVANGIDRYVQWVRTTPNAIPDWMRAETSTSRINAWRAPAPL